MTAESRPWILPVLAHLAVVISLPFWLLVVVFGPLVLAGYDGPTPFIAYAILAYYWLTPALCVPLLGWLWYALYHRQDQRANQLALALLVLAGSILAVQLLS